MAVWDAVYYTFIISGLAYLVSLIVAVHKPMWLLYCFQDLLLGLYFAALDRDLIRWFGLDAADQDGLVLVTAVALLVYGFLTQAYLITPSHSLARFKRPLHLLAFVAACLLPLGLAFEVHWLSPLVAVLLVLALMSMLLPPLTWSFLPIAAKQIAMPTIIFVVFVVAAILLVGLSFFELTDEEALIMRRVIMVWSIIAGVITMAYMTRNIEQTRRREANRALRSAKKEAELANSLFQAEVEYSRVRDLALERSAQLQGVGHDLRQPLFSLRTTLGLLDGDNNQSLTLQMREALEYADQLANTYLNSNAQTLGQDQTAEVVEAEPVELSVYLETLLRMYQQPARASNIELRVCNSSARITARPTAVMRMLTNIVSNALQHSGCTKLLLGVRRRSDGICLEVHDNGTGIGFEAPKSKRTEQLANDNYGMGLGIVAELCNSAGFAWKPIGIQGRGSIMRISIPASQVN